jgi:putative toxin-antitoxin system antitoxin component (TIGR02293 family)
VSLPGRGDQLPPSRYFAPSANWHENIDKVADPAYTHRMSSAITKANSSLSAGDLLGLKTENFPALIRQVERGFSYQSLHAMESRSGIPIARLAEIIGIPERTLARRRTSGRLSPDESERLLRISRVFSMATDLFDGESAAALKWLTTSRKGLDHQAPLNYSRTEIGAREVENLIGRLEDGVFS